MLAEVDERSANGEIARIFAEVRHLWGVPYVSAIHRHLATRPGVLEWAWEAVGPAFRSGAAQEAGWRAAAGLRVPPLDPISHAALSAWGIDEAGLQSVRDVVEGFVRVAPINMMFAGLVKALFEGRSAGGATELGQSWVPPKSLPAPPPMISPDELPATERAMLLAFAAPTGGTPFVPGMYRMLAHWPGLLAHLSVVLAPRLTAPETAAACDALRHRIDASVPDVLASLPAPPAKMPAPEEQAHFVEVGKIYRKTSPDLVVLGGLIRDALPTCPIV